eukprot:1988754-Lingulodinium_polyedra.AAC.1
MGCGWHGLLGPRRRRVALWHGGPRRLARLQGHAGHVRRGLGGAVEGYSIRGWWSSGESRLAG